MTQKNVEWANELLSYSIRVLQGKEFRANPKTLFQYALDNKRVLADAGYWWQARTLDYWIHRFQRGEFTDHNGVEKLDRSLVTFDYGG